MYLKTLNLGDIHPYEHNPRINDNAVEPVMKSIQKDGYRARIIVDKDGVIIAGHTRYKAMQKLGWTEAEVWIADDMTEEQIHDYRIRDNLTSDFASWDFTELEAEVAELELDFDMSEFGFTDEQAPSLMDAMQEDFGVAGEAKAMGTVTLTFDEPEEAEEVKSYIRKNEQAGVCLAVLNYVRGYDA